MRFRFWVVAYLTLGMPGVHAQTANDPQLKTLSTDAFSIVIDDRGAVCSITDLGRKQEVLPAGRSCPVLSVKIDDKTFAPTAAVWSDMTLELSYEPSGAKARVAVAARPTHVSFELLSVTPKEKVDMVVWGPFTCTSNQKVADLVGFIWDQDFALGLQSLNPKTVVSAKNQEKVLEGHCRNYERPQEAAAYGHTFTACFPGEDVAGSRVALFGCPADKTLATIEAIELAEGLPHVTCQGKWAKALPGTPYLGFEFGEDTIDQFIQVAIDSGIKYIYHPSPWQTWGHFEPKKDQFPNGRAGFKACVDKAHQAGLRVGVHTLGTFITADDAYVTPKPDPRLASSGSGTLAKDATEKDTVLEVADGAAFSAPGQKKCIRIGDELVMYGSVVGSKPARLENCERGKFGTTAQPHRSGTEAARLIMTDFFGPIFLGNRELNREIAQRGGRNCIEFDLDKYEFDGVEGTTSCGLEYGSSVSEFAKAWYDALGEKQGKVMLGGSGLSNYTNHIMDCVNWGEPWGDTFRKGMLDYRFMRMEQYKRNMLPHMLGQYAAQMYAIAGNGRPELNRCRVEDIEWLMALRCGHDAGFSLTFTPDWEAYLRGKNASPIEALMLPNIAELTAAMRAWETAYQAKAFPDDVKTLIGDRNRDFHLVANGPASWTLSPIHVAAATLEPGKQTINTDSPYDQAAVNFVIFNLGSPVSTLALGLPGNVTVPLTDVELQAEEIIRYTGGAEATIYGRNWDKRRTVSVDPRPLILPKGPAECALQWTGDAKAKLEVELRLIGPARELKPGE